MRNRPLLRFPILVLVLIFAPAALAQIPRTLSYQGALTDNGGNAVPDGTYSVTFRLYTAANGGSAIWTETQSLQVNDGILSAVLGAVTPIGEGVSFAQPYWLGVQVAPGSELSPRVPLTSVGYSLRAAVADAASGFTVPMELSGATTGTSSLLTLVNTGTGRGLLSVIGSTVTEASAVRGVINNSGAGPSSAGVRGENAGTGAAGIGVWGSQNGSGWGVYGTSVSGRGMYGLVTAVSGETYGVVGRADSQNGRGVFGFAPSATGTTYGVLASSASTNGRGVYGLASATTGNTYGVHGRSESSGGRGIVGEAPHGSGSTIGVYGVVTSPAGRGVYGYAAATSGSASGVYGESSSSSGRGVSGVSTSGTGVGGNSTSGTGVIGASTSGVGVLGASGNSHGVRATTNDPLVPALFAENPIGGSWARLAFGNIHNESIAARFSGWVDIWGGLFADNLTIFGSKNFRIDHPLDPEGKYLNHAAIESPEVLNFYNGNVTSDAVGIAVVYLPAYFEALNIEYRYQLTVMGEFAQAIISREIENNSFEIRTDRPNVRVSWQVTGVRNDPYLRANPMVAEQEKRDGERGRYLQPELYGAPPERGIRYPHSTSAGNLAPPGGEPLVQQEQSPLEPEQTMLRDELARLEAQARRLEEEIRSLREQD